MLDRVYGHHHPDHLRAATQAIGYRPRQSSAVSLTVKQPKPHNAKQIVETIGGPGRTRSFNQANMSQTRSSDNPAKSDDSDVT